MKAKCMIGVALATALLAACAPSAMDRTAGSARSASDTPGALFVAGKFGNTLARIDLATGRETARVDSCANPHELATASDGEHVALACYGGTTLDIFRTADLAKVRSIEQCTPARDRLACQWRSLRDGGGAAVDFLGEGPARYGAALRIWQRAAGHPHARNLARCPPCLDDRSWLQDGDSH